MATLLQADPVLCEYQYLLIVNENTKVIYFSDFM